MQRSQAPEAEATTTAAAVSARAVACPLDPTGLSSKAYGQPEVALQREMWNRVEAEDKPFMDQASKQTKRHRQGHADAVERVHSALDERLARWSPGYRNK